METNLYEFYFKQILKWGLFDANFYPLNIYNN